MTQMTTRSKKSVKSVKSVVEKNTCEFCGKKKKLK